MKKRNKKDGFTVLETMIASTILAVVMASSFPMADQMLGRIHMTRDHYVATTINQARVERARQIPYQDLDLMRESNTLVDDFGNLAAPDGRFQRTTEVLKDTPVKGMTQMIVTTQICICCRWGWLRHLHPIKTEKRNCHFTEEHEETVFLFTEYELL